LTAIGINGFGRMGRLGLRAAWGWPDMRFVKVNEIATDATGSAHLLTFDSVHGRWPVPCTSADGDLGVDGARIEYSMHGSIADGDWSGCDVVVETTGRFRTVEKVTGFLDQGVARVVVAAPVDGVPNIVVGVNDDGFDPAADRIVTAASCTTNCLAPLVKVMHESVGIVRGTMTTIHDVTNTQHVVDHGHRDLRRARACGQSLIPTSTGSARAIGKIFPELDGRLNGLAVRVPLLNASLVDFVFEAARSTTVEEVNGLLREAAEGALAPILGYEERPLVSADYRGDPRSAIVDGPSTMVVDGRMVKLLAWYDNEWAYANRLMELVRRAAALP
jgi:glyceraldehyde 3-phosphate dehydrogenase